MHTYCYYTTQTRNLYNVIYIAKNNFCLIKCHHWKVLHCTGSVLSRWSSLRGPAPAGQSAAPAAQ